jgi:DNA-binding NtrC family response regulator
MTTSSRKPAFDAAAEQEMSGHFRACPPFEFLRRLDGFQPRARTQTARFEKYRGWALMDDGDYVLARTHLLRALRLTAADDPDRLLLRGILGDSYIRVGELGLGERCVHAALSSDLSADRDHHLEAGHLFMFARIQYFRGQMSSALRLLDRVLELIDPVQPMWVPALSTVALCHFQRGDWDTQRAVLDRARAGEGSGAAARRQSWSMAEPECWLSLAQGDAAGALDMLGSARRAGTEAAGTRVAIWFDALESLAWCALGQAPRAEALVRPWLLESLATGRNTDVLVVAALALSTSLHQQGRFEEAIAPALTAARIGRTHDRRDLLLALRLLGDCHVAAGHREEARRAFGEALSVHAGTEHTVERALLERSLSRAGLPGLTQARTRARPPVTRSRPARLHRLPLRSGRALVTCDPHLVDAIRSAACSTLPVLVEGETGTGKELVARLIHESGPRARRDAVIVDCTTLPAALAESELFGVRRGAFSGADADRAGLVGEAEGGTLILDELPELSPELQAKLLRLIQEGEYRRLGETRPRRADVRFVATTNRGVEALLAAGRLKPDLLFRLDGHRIRLRPLRERPEEIAPLFREFAGRSGLGRVNPEAEGRLRAARWPGNVRQLEMLVRVVAAELPPGAPLDLTTIERHLSRLEDVADAPAASPATLRDGRVVGERSTLLAALTRHGGVVSHAARSLGMSRQAFYKALQRTGLSPRPHTGRGPSASTSG